MIKLSTKGHYGARLMLDLALHYGEGPVLLKDIANRQEISVKYLWNLVESLRVAGLVESYRGRHGGYSLAKKPSEITMKDIIYVFEGRSCLVDCVCNPKYCERSEACVTRDLWGDISNQISDILEAVTLEDMMKRHEEKQKCLSVENISGV